MARKEPLFDLIHAMTSAEKRHFRMQAERYEGRGKDSRGHKYLELFDLLAKRRAYPRDEALALYNGARAAAHLAAAKNYLLNALVDSLLSLDRPKTSDEEIKAGIREARLFQGRGMPYRAEQLFRRSLEKARLTHNYLRLGECLESLSSLYSRWQAGTFDAQQIQALQDGIVDAADRALEFSRNRRHHYIFHKEIVRWRTRPEQRPPEWKRFVEEDWFLRAEHSPNPRARTYYHQVLGEYYTVTGDIQRSYGELHKAFAEYRSVASWKEDRPDNYVSFLNNLLGRALVAERWADMPAMIEELRELRPGGSADDRRYESWALYRLIHAVLSGREVPPAELSEIEGGLSNPRLNRAFELAIKLELGIHALVFGDQDRATDWANAFLNDPNHTKLRQHAVFGNLLRFLLYVEAEQSDLLDYALTNYRRRLGKAGYAFPYEAVMVDGLFDWVQAPEGQRREALQKMDRALVSIRGKQPFYVYLDFQAWIESRMTGHPMSACMRARFRE